VRLRFAAVASVGCMEPVVVRRSVSRMGIIDTARAQKRRSRQLGTSTCCPAWRANPESGARQSMSAFVRRTDSSQTLRHVRYGPTAEVAVAGAARWGRHSGNPRFRNAAFVGRLLAIASRHLNSVRILHRSQNRVCTMWNRIQAAHQRPPCGTKKQSSCPVDLLMNRTGA
jgi:hypothetical protein